MIHFLYRCLLLCCLLVCTSAFLPAQTYIIPQPNSIVEREGKCTLLARFKVMSTDPRLNFATKELVQIIHRVQNNLTLDTARTNYIYLTLQPKSKLSAEAYELEIGEERIDITASSPRGIYYGVMTLRQILGQSTCATIPCIQIKDEPRYPLRGLMLDPARHFLPTSDVKAYIDRMAYYKFNTLQLHLTDDQGWRLFIPEHPRLTSLGAYRSQEERIEENGYYTPDELRELVSYAAERGVEIIPEIDVPGHTAALLTAYPELRTDILRDSTFTLGRVEQVMLSAANPKVYQVLEDVISTLSEIFPRGARFHLGGDESALETNWAVSPEHHRLMQAEGLQDSGELMHYFFLQLLNITRRYGFQPMLWCELDNIYPPAKRYLFPYPQDVTLVSWRAGLTPKSIELTRASRHSLVLAPGESAYLDYPQYPGDLPEHNNWGMPITTLEQTYTWDLRENIGVVGDNHIIGIMGTLWGEAIKDINRAFYMTYPRALALAEQGWCQRERRSWQRFIQALPWQLGDLLRSGISFRAPFEVYQTEQKSRGELPH